MSSFFLQSKGFASGPWGSGTKSACDGMKDESEQARIDGITEPQYLMAQRHPGSRREEAEARLLVDNVQPACLISWPVIRGNAH